MRTPRPLARRRGTVLPLLALTVTLLFAFVALAVDVGVLTIARTEGQNGCDAAALAGARVLNNRPSAVNNDSPTAVTVARNTALQNINVFVQQDKKYTVADNMTFASGQAIEVGQYNYNSTTQRFDVSFPTNAGGTSWTAVKVRMKGEYQTFFAKVVGVNSMPWETYAVAAHRPRDVAIILDFSASMQFGSQFCWETGFGGSTGPTYGMLNPDPVYPQFGHYQRYTAYSETATLNSTNAGATTVGSRTNPLWTTQPYTMSSGEVCAAGNHTVETPSGPPTVLDFRFDPSNVNSPATPATTPTPSTFWNAFNRWMRTTPAVENVFLDPSFRPAVSGSTNQGSYVERTFNWSGYNAFDKTNQYGPTPAPDSFQDQSDADAPYAGDRSARKGGQIFTASTSWDPNTATGAARNVRELLSKATASNTSLLAPAARATTPGTVPGGYSFPAAGDGGTTWNTFRDDLWETYGYDLDVAKYSGTSPSGTNRATAQKRTADLFQGFSMGPGYYGKTFFMWPPDPRFDATANVASPHATNLATDSGGRAMHDWRRRFFYKSGVLETVLSGRFNPQTDNINGTLLNAGTGRTLSGTTANYKVNYRAVLAWLKSGPMTLPPNLRAGRILYYASIPDDVDDLTNLDKRFWRDYIDYVLGYTGNVSNYDPNYCLAGQENKAWPEGGAVSLLAPAAHLTNPKPYMSYTDVPSTPRLHFWFGPLTMMNFISARQAATGRNYWAAGTVHEAQCWQLKAGMNSALDDIKNNHPNDFCSLQFFSNYLFQKPRVTMGQNWTDLKNSLFYPNTLVPAIAGGDTTTELRPYDASLNNDTLAGNLPNADGGTDPVSGFAMAFNTLSWSSQVSNARTAPNNTTANGGSGRRGAAKIVIYETDGVPNGRPAWTYQALGVDAYWKEGGSNPGSDAADDSIKVVNKMMLQQGSGGMSLPNAPCKVHCLAFGDLFNVTPYTAQAQAGLLYLLNVQKAGGTSPATATAYTDFPAGKIITGPYQTRITNLRSALEQIMQSGIQVTLVQ